MPDPPDQVPAPVPAPPAAPVAPALETAALRAELAELAARCPPEWRPAIAADAEQTGGAPDALRQVRDDVLRSLAQHGPAAAAPVLAAPAAVAGIRVPARRAKA
jgi:hypothetical protein